MDHLIYTTNWVANNFKPLPFIEKITYEDPSIYLTQGTFSDENQYNSIDTFEYKLDYDSEYDSESDSDNYDSDINSNDEHDDYYFSDL